MAFGFIIIGGDRFHFVSHQGPYPLHTPKKCRTVRAQRLTIRCTPTIIMSLLSLVEVGTFQTQ